ncbi:sensor histidine kinase [Bacillus sp. 31A1R]|uniref:histidine kinase n=2 Tax=Robertmurraya mangrovi TaxID=3098077 RepID=A0ABU5IT09_9BACI|nr:sensor histidine kinase [Bacillus sp. 31A1R]
MIIASLWGIMIYSPTSKHDVFLFLLCAFSLAVYFLIPVITKKFIFINLLLVGSFFYCLIIEPQLHSYFFLFMLLYVFDLAFYMKPFPFLVNLVVIHLFFLFGYFQMETHFIVIYLNILFSLVLYKLNSYYYESLNKSTLYEQLLEQFRKIKRQSIKNEQVARQEERTRMTREIHDSVGHKLTALSMQIEMLLMKEKSEMLQGMKVTVGDCLEETRRAVRALHHEDIEGLSSVIHLLRKLESESHLRVNFTTKHGVLGISLSNKNNIVLYRVIQESLTNAMKYGHSREVEVTLGISPIGDLLFRVMNHYHYSTPINEGFGLKNMRERVEEIGGVLHVYQKDEAFIVEGTIPIER